MKYHLPRDEWVVINQQAMAEEEARQRSQKQLQHLKQIKYREYLDQSVRIKQARKQLERDYERNYYENLLSRQNTEREIEMKDREKSQKQKRLALKKYQHELESRKEQRIKTEQQLRSPQPEFFPFEVYQAIDFKGKLIPSYNQQIERKRQKKMYQHHANREMLTISTQKQIEIEERRKQQLNKISHGYSQNRAVYENYFQIQKTKNQRLAAQNKKTEKLQHELEARIQEEEQRRQQQHADRTFQYRKAVQNQMQAKREKEEFLKQMKLREREEIDRLVSQQHTRNSNMSYSHAQYNHYLQKQIQDKKIRNMMGIYMTDTQLRMNKPKLQKVISNPLTSSFELLQSNPQRIIKRELGLDNLENKRQQNRYRPRDQQVEHLHDRILPYLKHK